MHVCNGESIALSCFGLQVNGSEGIGTGWSSSVPNYNPLDIIENIRRKIRGEVSLSSFTNRFNKLM